MEFEDDEELINDIKKSLDDIDPEIEAIAEAIDVIVGAFEATTDKLPARRKRAFGYGIISYLAHELGMNVDIEDMPQ